MALTLGLVLLGPVAIAARAAQTTVAVVTPPGAPAIALDRANLRDIFLRRIVIDDAGAALVPVNLPAADPLRLAFSVALLGKDPAALQRYWNERYFHGVSPPYVVRSQEAVLRFVAQTPGAVGYVASCRVDGRVRVVARLPVPPDLRARINSTCARRRGAAQSGP